MRIVTVSDTHGMHDQVTIPEGDVLIHSGDCTDDAGQTALRNFLIWFEKQPCEHKVLVAGNHDWAFEKWSDLARLMVKEVAPSVNYLQGSGLNIGDVLFWGSPITPEFCGWAFNRQRGAEIKAHWDHIPRGVDVLVTHGPPHGILDYNPGDKLHCGCEDLRDAVQLHRPKLHVFGHIHAGYGWSKNEHTTFINAACCDERYYPTNKPQIFEL